MIYKCLFLSVCVLCVVDECAAMEWVTAKSGYILLYHPPHYLYTYHPRIILTKTILYTTQGEKEGQMVTREVCANAALQVSLKGFRGVIEGGYYTILVVSCMWSGALDSSDLLLSYPVMPLASPMTNILISTLL